MKRRIISFILALTLVLMLIPATIAAPIDTASGWARDGITDAVGKGFVPAGLQYNYTNVITRAEFCRLAVQYIEYVTGTSIDTVLAGKGVSRNPNAFTDTSDQDILAAFALNITSGVGNNKFNPDGGFTREQAAGMILNVGKVLGMNADNIRQLSITDLSDVSSWCVDGVNFCFANGIMGSTSTASLTFSPKLSYTREQSIVTFNNIKIGATPEPPVPLPAPAPTPAPGGTSAKDAVQYASRSIAVSGKSFTVQTLTVDLKNPKIKLDVVMPNKKLNNTVSFTALMKDRNPIAAVNGNFFKAYDTIKDPIGHLMINGEFLHASSGNTSIGFTKDNDVIFGMPGAFTKIYTTDNSGGSKAEECTVYEINTLVQKGNQAILYTPARGASAPITNSGLIIEVADNTVTRHYNVSPGDTAVIPSNGYLLYFNEQVAALSYVKPISIGRKVAVKYTMFTDNGEPFDLDNSRFILSGSPRLIRNGAIDTTPLPSGFAGDNRFSVNSAPRTAAGRLSDGKLILASTSSTITELKEIMKQLGCTDAVNLDGGASAAMYYNGSVVRAPGRELTSILMIVEE